VGLGVPLGMVDSTGDLLPCRQGLTQLGARSGEADVASMSRSANVSEWALQAGDERTVVLGDFKARGAAGRSPGVHLRSV
jgi:hypothetical protein